METNDTFTLLGLNPELDDEIELDTNKIYPGFENKKCKHHSDCPSGHECHRPGIRLAKGVADETVCCPGKGYPLLIPPGGNYCEAIPDDFVCVSHKGCVKGGCGHLGTPESHKQCCSSGETYNGDDWRPFCAGMPAKSPCRSDPGCASGNCDEGFCSSTPKKPLITRIEDFILFVGGVIAVIIILVIIMDIAKK